MAELVQLKYPNYITNEDWKYRCVKIIVRKNPALASDPKQTLEKIKDTGAKILETVSDSASTGDISTLAEKMKKWDAIEKTETIMGIGLPLPNELVDTQTHRWELTESNISDLANKGLDKVTFGNKNRADKILGEMSARTGFRKPIINPGYFQNYKGTDPRNMVLTFTLIPNNEEEATSISNIIYNLKKYSLPETAPTGLFLNAPYFFDLEIGNPYIDNLMNFKNVVITNLTVSYGVDGAMQFFANGMPKIINMSVSFAERRLQTSSNY